MDEKKECPIDQTELTAFNQFDLQDGTICRDCAKKMGLIDGKNNNRLAKAAKLLLTINVSKDYIAANKSIDTSKLLEAYTSETEPTENHSEPSTIDDSIKNASNETNTNTSSAETNNQAQSDSDSDATIADTNSEDTSTDKSIKKEPAFWKGDAVKGFVYGIALGLFVGFINMVFLGWWHIGLISWLAVWLFVGTNPQFKDTRSNAEKQIASQRQNVKQSSEAEKQQSAQTIIVNNVTESPKKHKPLFHGLVCPRCGSANIQLVSSDANVKSVKTKTRVTADINPLHPLTVAKVKHRTKVTKRHSPVKTTAALVTMGASTLVTGGTRSNKSREYHCQDCGKTFFKK